MVRPNLNCDVVLALQTTASRPDWAQCNSAILSYHEIFTEAVSRQLAGDKHALQDLDPEESTVPDDFVDYVKGPAAALLTEKELWRYVFTGEATRSTYGVSLLQLISSVGRLVRTVGEVDGAATSDEQDTRKRALTKEVNSLGEQLRSYSFGTGVTSAWSALERVVQESSDGSPEKLGEWVASAKQNVREVLRELLTYYKSGAIGVSSTGTRA